MAKITYPTKKSSVSSDGYDGFDSYPTYFDYQKKQAGITPLKPATPGSSRMRGLGIGKRQIGGEEEKKQGKGSEIAGTEIGGTLGYLIGSAVTEGSPIGGKIGAAIGGYTGKFVGSKFGGGKKDRSAEMEAALRLHYSTVMGTRIKGMAEGPARQFPSLTRVALPGLEKARAAMTRGGDIAGTLGKFNEILKKLGSREGIPAAGTGQGGGIGTQQHTPIHGAGGTKIPLPRGTQGRQFAGEIGELGVNTGGGDIAPAVGYSAGVVGTTKTPMARGTVSARGSGEDINRLLGLLA